MTDKEHWHSLLLYKRFSIGPFVVSLTNDTVRVFHSRKNQTYRFPKKESFERMQDLCRVYHYDIHYLLQSCKPKSVQYLAESERRFRTPGFSRN